ncbi:MAG: M14 family metallopeptidase [Flavobacteriaceae bacterium]
MRQTILLWLILFASCKSSSELEARKHRFPNPVNTKTRAITYQDKRIFNLNEVSATNNFPAARLNNFAQLNDSSYVASINPENTPINPSPWYAFKLWSKTPREVYVKLTYGNDHKHRYFPKISKDGANWQALDSSRVEIATDTTSALLKLPLSSDTLWIAAQEIQDYKRVGDWARSIGQNTWASLGSAGQSVLGRQLYFINISKGDHQNKPAILIISRQHPPEVTGYIAMRSFVETILKEGVYNGFLEKYRLMVYPLMNPDGVDLGHYRHNTGGVDLNRDWSKYRQPEIDQISDHMVRETVTNNNEVLLGLDFHSTYQDVYYTHEESVPKKIPDFTKSWLAGIQSRLKLEDINEQPGKISRPTSSGWYNQQFGATAITYEIGDNTPRDFIKIKGEVSAQVLMEYFLKL